MKKNCPSEGGWCAGERGRQEDILQEKKYLLQNTAERILFTAEKEAVFREIPMTGHGRKAGERWENGRSDRKDGLIHSLRT